MEANWCRRRLESAIEGRRIGGGGVKHLASTLPASSGDAGLMPIFSPSNGRRLTLARVNKRELSKYLLRPAKVG